MDADKVAGWAATFPDANIALRADGWLGIDVDAYDGKVGDQTLAQLEAELGELPVTITSTSRGEDSVSRIHFFRVPRGLEFVHNFVDVEIVQFSHRYAMVAPSIHPDTGEQYAWYGYEGEPLDEFPSIDDFEDLPNAWLEHFVALAKGGSDADGYEGSVAEWLERIPGGEPGLWMRERIAAIPQSDFGHDTMVSLQASMVTLAVGGETGGAEALKTLRREWLRGPYNTPEYIRDFDMALSSAVKKFGGFPPEPADILRTDQLELFPKVKDGAFLNLWTGLPPVVTVESLRERVARVMSIAFDSGLSILEAATLGWHSAAAQHPAQGFRALLMEPSALEFVWNLAVEVQGHPVAEERSFLVDLPTPVPEPVQPTLLPTREVKLLDDSETAHAASIRWWGTEFMEVMRKVNDPINEQYFHLSMWMILSLVYAPYARIVRKNGTPIIFNFYGILLGPTNTGKTESFEIVHQVMSQVDPLGGWDIGGKASSSGLADALIRRHLEGGGGTILHPDEADAVIHSWNEERGGFADMKQTITNIYTGRVPKHQLTTRGDTSGVDAQAYLNVLMTGITEKVADEIEPDDWISGFINRFVWAVGTRSEMTDEQLIPDFLEEGEEVQQSDLSRWLAQWAAHFGRTRRILIRDSGEPRLVSMDQDVRERHGRLKKDLRRIAASNGGYQERLIGTFNRLEVTILKCAALAALVDGRQRITMDDWLIAAVQGEEWVANIMMMIRLTNKTARARAVDKLAELVARNGGRMPYKEIHSTEEYQGDSWGTGNLIKELEAQGRAEVLNKGIKGSEVLSLVSAA